MSWSDLSDWWSGEIGDDPAYETVVTPLLMEVLDPVERATYLDLGSGEGRVMRAIESSGTSVLGVELSETLARESDSQTIVAQLPEIPVRNNSVDGAYAVLVIEHLCDHGGFFAETARVVRRGECLQWWPITRFGRHPIRHQSPTPTEKSYGDQGSTSPPARPTSGPGTDRSRFITAV